MMVYNSLIFSLKMLQFHFKCQLINHKGKFEIAEVKQRKIDCWSRI